jgi:hypothetical protein
LFGVEGQPPQPARTLDLNANGISLTMAGPAQPGVVGTVRFDIFYEGKAHPVTARVKVAYCIFSGGEFKLGLSFVNLDLAAMSAVAKFLK